MKQTFYLFLSLGLTLSFGLPIAAQSTYPVFPNIMDNSLSSESKLLGESANRLVYFDVISGKNKLWISGGTPQSTILVSPPDQSEIEVFHHDTSGWYFTEKRGSTYSISVLKNEMDTLTPLHSSGIRYQDILFWKGSFSWIQQSAGSNYSRVQLYDPIEDTLVTLINLSYLSIRSIGASDSLIFFIASTDTGKMLGSSEGTTASSKFITTLFPFGSSFDQQTRFFSNGKKVYFFYHPTPDPFVLWTTDGTEEGTMQLGEFQNPSFGWPDDPAIFLEDKLFFILREPDAPSGTTFEINATDGTPEGTLTLDDSPNDYTQPSDLTRFGSKVYFISFSWGADLRESDGTLEGTKIVLNAFGHQNGGIGGIAALGTFDTSLVIQAYEGVHGSELYICDGTEAGTTLLSDVIRGSTSSYPSKFCQVGGRLFFTAEYANRERLWVYDPQFSFSCDSFVIDTLNIVSVTDSTMGSIAISMVGGQQPFLYSINGGSHSYNATFSNLSAGTYELNIIDNLGCSVDTTIVLSTVTSVLETERIKSVSVRPNPSHSAENITVAVHFETEFANGPLETSVYSIEGKLYHRSFSQVTSSYVEYKIDTRGWPKGQYILSFQADNSIIASELLIVH